MSVGVSKRLAAIFIGVFAIIAHSFFNTLPLIRSDCDCPTGFTEIFVNAGVKQCFGQRPQDDFCQNKSNMHPVDEGAFCWDGKPTVQCRHKFWAGLQNSLLFSSRFLQFGGHYMAAKWNDLRMNPGDPQSAINGCERQAYLLGGASPSQKPSEAMQLAIVSAGLHKTAVEAMFNHPDHRELQALCSNLLIQTVAWNARTMNPVAEAGAMNALMDYYKRFSHVQDVMNSLGGIGHFMDFSLENQIRFREMGGLKQFIDWAETNYSAGFMCSFQCMVSTQAPEANREMLVSLGYFPLMIRNMRDFRSGSCGRGEAIWDISLHYWQRPEWLDELYKLGFMEEVFAAMRDEPNEFDQGRSLDPIGHGDKVGMTRLLQSSMVCLNEMAKRNSTRSAAFIELGVFDEVVTMLHRVGDLRQTSVWGSGFDVTVRTCEALISVVQNAPEPDVALKKSGVLESIARIMKSRPDKHSLGACHNLMALHGSS